MKITNKQIKMLANLIKNKITKMNNMNYNKAKTHNKAKLIEQDKKMTQNSREKLIKKKDSKEILNLKIV